MAFKDTPQIDRFSKNSNKSEIALEGCLNQTSGFICRSDVPDKGCDYDVELIENGSNATAWRFALQLKSIEKLNLVSEDSYISYAFETSRLGYIMRRIPGGGLIALYSLERDKIFFDFADKIYERLMTERDSDEWQNNETVNIRIPIENVMNNANIENIHNIFINRFRSAAKMQSSHGAKYGLPTANLSGDTGYDWNNLDDVKKMLVEYGIFLLNNYDLHIVYELISRLSHNEICADRELLKLAAATYCEIGMYSEARLYNKRFLKPAGITSNEKMLSDYIELKIRLGLGEVSIHDFIATATDISNRDTNEHNKIMLEINITFYKLLELKADEEMPECIKLSINDIQSRIKKSTVIPANIKAMFGIWNAENLGLINNKLNHEEIAKFRLKEYMGYNVDLDSRKNLALKAINREMEFAKIAEELSKDLLDLQDPVLEAYLKSVVARHFLSKEITTITFDIIEKSDDHKRLLLSRINLLLNAYQIYIRHNLFKEAHSSLCDALELLDVSTQYYEYNDDVDKEAIIRAKLALEEHTDLTGYKLVVTELIKIQKDRKHNLMFSDNQFTFLKEMDDSKLDWFAKKLNASLELNYNQFENLRNEIKALRIFANRCTDSNIQALRVYNEINTQESAYNEPVKFILRSKATGLRTHESIDMNELLEWWRM